MAASEPNKEANPVSLLGEEIAELKEGLTTFQENAFESLYDKKMQWGKGPMGGKTDAATESETSKPTEPAAPPKATEVAVVKVEDVVDEKPVAKKNVEAEPTIAKVVTPEPVKIAVKVEEVIAPAMAKKVEAAPVVAEKKAEVKKVAEVKKGGGLFGFLQSDSAVQQIANKNQPTAPPAIAKAFMAPAPTPTPVKKEVKKSPEGLNMAMFKQDAEEIEAKKAMMASRPSLADAKAEAAKADAPKIPTGAPIKAPIVPAEPAKNAFSFLTPPKAAVVEKKEPAAVAPKAAPPAVKAPAPVPLKKAPAPGGFFSFLTSDPSLVKPADPNARAPTSPPAVARAFMGPSPTDMKKEGEVMSLAAMKRKAEYDQDVLDEEVKKKMMAARPSIAAAKSEASKTPSKQQLRDIAAKEAGKVATAKKAPAGLFDIFGSDSGSSSSGDLFEPRDPNALTVKEVAMIKAAPGAVPGPVAPKKIVSAPAPAPKMAAPAPAVKPAAPAGGGMFGFMNKAAAPAPVKAAPVAVKAPLPAPVPVPAPVKAPAPAGGMFGFMNQQKAPAPVKAAPVPVVTKAPVPAPAPVVKPAAPAGGMFGFMNQAKPPAPVKAAPVAVKAPLPAPVPVPAPVKAPAPAGGMFGFMNQPKAPAPVKAAPSPVAAVKAVAAVAPKKAVSASAPAPVPAVKAPTSSAPSGGFFGFLNAPPASTKAAPEAKVAAVAPVKAAPVPAKKAAPVPAPAPVKAAAPAGGMFGFMNQAKPPAKAVIAEVKEVPVVAAKKAAPASGGLFGFMKSEPKEAPVKAVAPSAAKAAPVKAAPVKAAPVKAAAPVKKAEVAVGMNVKFLASISRLLKGDSGKIKSFQTATDSFRSGAISGDAFLKILETLFGESNLESVVVPLVSELPERDAATKLRASFDKKSSMMKKSSAPAEKKAPFSFSFGGAPKKVEAPAPVVVAVPVPAKKEGFSFPSFGGSKPAAAPASKASVAVKLPAGIPAAKKSAVESQITQLLAGGDAKVFYKNISKDLGKPKTIEVMAEIIKSLPKPIGLKVDAVFKADK